MFWRYGVSESRSRFNGLLRSGVARLIARAFVYGESRLLHGLCCDGKGSRPLSDSQARVDFGRWSYTHVVEDSNHCGLDGYSSNRPPSIMQTIC